MNVLFFTRSFYPNIGGVEKHIYKLSKVLIDRGLSVTIVTEKSYSNNYQSEQSSAKELDNSNLNIVEIDAGKDNWFKKFRIWKELFLKIGLIKNADIIHCHDVYFWYMPFRILFPFKKNFVTFHGYEGNNLPAFKAKFMHKVSEILSNGNICVGKFLEKWYGTKANLITYGAVDQELLKDKPTSKEFLNRGVFIGRFEEETGILEYLEAIKILKDKKLKVELDVYGNGSLHNKSIKFVKKHNLQINFRGLHSDTDSILYKYDFALVSRYLSIFEAIAARLPVFSHYNNRIKKDYLEMTPFAKFILISNDAKKIADGINNYFIYGNKNKVAAFNWVKDKTWDKMADNYLILWGLNFKSK